MNKKLNKNQYKEISELYNLGLSTAKIGKTFNVSPQTISNFLHKFGIKLRTRKEACTKYNINSSFFKNINTEEKAYWLGFLTADGGIVKNEIILSLKKDDKNHIEKFIKSIESNHPIKTVKHIIKGKVFLQPRLTISSVPLVNSLKTLGVGERKSFTVKPAIIPKKFQTAYWRGCFDGDGHINVKNTSRVMEFTGNKYIVEGFIKFIQDKTGITSKLQKDKRVYRLRQSKRASIQAISKLLYYKSSIHLDRKYEIAKTIFLDEFFHLRKNSIKRHVASAFLAS